MALDGKFEPPHQNDCTVGNRTKPRTEPSEKIRNGFFSGLFDHWVRPDTRLPEETMSIKTASSTIALTAAAMFALSASALGQTMVGGQEVSDEDLEFVIVHCQWLVGVVDPIAMGAEPMDGTDPDNEVEVASDDGEASEGISDAVDIDLITMEDCEAAGLPPT